MLVQHRAEADLPDWAARLNNYYWRVRVEGRNKTIKRSFYRLIRIERLRLVEMGYNIEHVDAVCKYLVSLKQVNAERVMVILESEPKQLRLDF